MKTNAIYSNKFIISLKDVSRIKFVDERSDIEQSSIEVVMTIENFRQLIIVGEQLLRQFDKVLPDA